MNHVHLTKVWCPLVFGRTNTVLLSFWRTVYHIYTIELGQFKVQFIRVFYWKALEKVLLTVERLHSFNSYDFFHYKPLFGKHFLPKLCSVPSNFLTPLAESGRRGFIPHNMIMELNTNHSNHEIQHHSILPHGSHPINTPVRRMVALYDYDPQELSPNVDAEVSIRNNMDSKVWDAIQDPFALP